MWVVHVLLHVFAWQSLVGLAVIYFLFRRPLFLFFSRTGVEEEIHAYIPKRVLGHYEAGLALVNQNMHSIRLTSVHLLDGDFSVNCIRQGLRVMQARYPILRMSTHYSGPGELRFHEYEDAFRRVQLDVVRRKSEDHWRQELQYQAFIGAPPPVTHNQLLWRVVLLFNTDVQTPRNANSEQSQLSNSGSNSGKSKRHELILANSHCALDGTSSVMFGALLVHYCTRLQNSVKDIDANNREAALELFADALCIEVYQKDLPLSIEDLSVKHPQYRSSLTWPQAVLPTVPRSIFGFLAHVHHVQPFTFVPIGKRRDRVDCSVLEPQHLTHLRELCREHSVTVQGALMGAGFKAYQETFKLAEGHNVEAACPIRLGNLLNVDRKELGVFVSHCYENTRLHARTADIWQYAASSHAHLHVNPATRVPVLAFQEMVEWPGLKLVAGMPPIIRLVMKVLSKTDGGRTCNFMISNLGDLSQFVPDQIEAWREAYLSQDARGLGCEFFIFTHSFRGQLHISTTWTEPLMPRSTAELFVRNFLHFLCNPATNAA